MKMEVHLKFFPAGDRRWGIFFSLPVPYMRDTFNPNINNRLNCTGFGGFPVP
jgi:hypothetical protein